MELIVNKNSYMSIEDADLIVTEVFFDDEDEAKLWKVLSDIDKARIIYRGTKIINKLPFIGVQMMNIGELRWPRYINYEYKECPEDIKIALLKQALRDRLNSSKEEIKMQDLGVKTYSIKGASITFKDNDKSRVNSIHTDIYYEYLHKWVY
jgi:hypothetical protein